MVFIQRIIHFLIRSNVISTTMEFGVRKLPLFFLLSPLPLGVVAGFGVDFGVVVGGFGVGFGVAPGVGSGLKVIKK